jgi:ketosteroid isomerase-like protein
MSAKSFMVMILILSLTRCSFAQNRADNVHPNVNLIRNFYQAFNNRNFAGMHACYHRDVRFSDPIFPDIDAAHARAMWRMLCTNAKDLKVVATNVRADATRGTAHWEAWYKFGPKRRDVHNVVDATFEFREGLIVQHTDRYNFWRWASQALGLVGSVGGWTSALQRRVRSEAAANLEKFMEQNPAPFAGLELHNSTE